jgi:hypothetical protein
VRATTTILRVFKANGAQFVYQKGARRRSPGAASRLIRPAAMIRGPFGPWAGCRCGEAGRKRRQGKPHVHHDTEIPVVGAWILPQRKPNSRATCDRA